MTDIKRIHQEKGPDLSYTSANILEEDGLFFKDLAKTGVLLPYEDYRLSYRERAEDLAKRLSDEEIIGLMLHSQHQSVPVKPKNMFPDTYDGEVFDETKHRASDMPDHQKDLLKKEHVRHLLQSSVKDVRTSAEWTNNLQAFCEELPYGIPVNISTDPRHGASSSFVVEFKNADKGVSKWPEGIGMAATFSKETVAEFASVASKEYRAMGITTMLGPQIDLATEPRWRRFEDTLGGNIDDVISYVKAYVTAMQESDTEDGWGKESVVTMVKHFPGGGSGEGGRDAHYAFGKYNVYPGNNYEEHVRPFFEAAYHLDGKIKEAAATMPYYSVSTCIGDKVGNSYNHALIHDYLRRDHGYDGVLCTDWDITRDPYDEMDSFTPKCHGMEEVERAERLFTLIDNGIDQIGGDESTEWLKKGFKLYEERYGREKTRERLEESAVRLLTNMFRLGLFEDPYLDPEESVKIVGSPEFRARGFEAQCDSIVLLKNNDLLPLKKGINIYVPDRHISASKSFTRSITPAKTLTPVHEEEAEGFFHLVKDPKDADVFLVWMESPVSDAGYAKEDREAGGNGYLPISLQYRPYTAVNARDVSLAGGDFREDFTNRTYMGKTAGVINESDLDNILDLKKEYPDIPLIACTEVHNPFIPSEFEEYADAFVVHFGVEKRALFTVLFGRQPGGRLPYPFPKDMDTVERHQEDVYDDYDHYVDSNGNEYRYGFGLTYKE